MADCQCRRINEADAGGGSPATEEIGAQRQQGRCLLFDKAVIADQMRKLTAQVLHDVFDVEVLECAIVRWWKRIRMVITSLTLKRRFGTGFLAMAQQSPLLALQKPLAEIIDIAEHFEKLMMDTFPG